MAEKSEKDKRLDRALRMLETAVAKDYYGKITFSFESGQIVSVKEEKTHKF